MKRLFIFLLSLIVNCQLSTVNCQLITTDGTHFIRNGEPYYFIGTNFWCAPILASTGQGGDRDRLRAELDSLKAIGIDNLRILVGADRGSANVVSVTPYLQTDGGLLNDTLLEGLDYLLCELERRDMVGVFYLTNSWDWSGGYGFYLRAAGFPDSPDAHGDGYDAYCAYAAQFYSSDEAKKMFADYVRKIVSRTNSITGRPYSESPAIMSWQICNEPRPFAAAQKEPMLRWLIETARLIKSLDPNHLVSTGSEGTIGCAFDADLCQRIHLSPYIDYLTVHVWPLNWGWSSRDRLFAALPNVYVKVGEYLKENRRIAEKIRKPMVIEEFGYARDRNFLAAGTPTRARDAFYNFVFQTVCESAHTQGSIAGCNFWGWGGRGRARDTQWQVGDDFLCDPPHEPQGWYSVFDCDSTTIALIRSAAAAL